MAKELTDNAETECLKLKKAINENHRLAQTAAGEAVVRGVLSGELLTRWKEMLPHGRFESFVDAHFDGCLRTAQIYMQAAKRLNALPKAQRSALLKQERSISGLISISDKGKPGGASSSPSTPSPASPGPASGEAADYPPEPQNAQDCLARRADGPGYGASTCPNCAGTVWDHDDDGWACSECHEPHGEPAGGHVADSGKMVIATIEVMEDGWVEAFDELWGQCPAPIKLVIRDRIQETPNGSEFVFALKGDKLWPLPVGKQDEYCTAYPAIDVEAQLRAAVQWCRDNPNRRKSARGMPRFLNGWLGAVAQKGKAGGKKNWLTEYLKRDKSKDST